MVVNLIVITQPPALRNDVLNKMKIMSCQFSIVNYRKLICLPNLVKHHYKSPWDFLLHFLSVRRENKLIKELEFIEINELRHFSRKSPHNVFASEEAYKAEEN